MDSKIYVRLSAKGSSTPKIKYFITNIYVVLINKNES